MSSRQVYSNGQECQLVKIEFFLKVHDFHCTALVLFCVWEKERVSLSSKVPIISRIHVHCWRFPFFFLTRIKIKQGEELYVPPLLNKWTKNKTLEVSELLKKKFKLIFDIIWRQKNYEREKKLSKKKTQSKGV